MALRLPDRFLWDFWTIEHDSVTWLYALSAPRDPDPETRHARARVELATSFDLETWTHVGPVLEPGAPGSWDDLAIWTGSVAEQPAGGFAMLYTGRSRAEEGAVQRIGLATSGDLVAWTKHPGPVIEANPHWYRTEDARGHCAWRDPWLEWRDGCWHAWITAQHRDGDAASAGCVAHATSVNLTEWTVHPPATDQRLSEHLEVPQIVAGGAAMLVNIYPHFVPEGSPLPVACASLLYRRDREVFRFERVIEAWPSDVRYVVKQVRPGLGLCWHGLQETGVFLGEISDPFPFNLQLDLLPTD